MLFRSVFSLRIAVTREEKTQRYSLPVDVVTEDAAVEDTNLEEVPF